MSLAKLSFATSSYLKPAVFAFQSTRHKHPFMPVYATLLPRHENFKFRLNNSMRAMFIST